ncbi:hypothetical protein DIPPA_01052 [Diplonema papillatum]|nr:hypothetical protein DIPPA_01052 [Diplonema papillatum]
MMVLATALKEVKPHAMAKPRSDSMSAIARLRNPRKGDPVAMVLCTLPDVQWARGHSDNADINAADVAANAAYQKSSTFNVEWCYRKANVARLCQRWQEDDTEDNNGDLVQLEENGLFARRNRTDSRDTAVRNRLSTDVPPRCLSAQALRTLRNLHGATDLLQALTRRAIMPFKTRNECAVEGCYHRGSADHVLTAGDERHILCYGPEANLTRIFGQSEVTYRQVLDEFAARNTAVIRSVCARVRYQEPSGKATEWATWLMHEIKSSSKIR